MKRDKGIRTMVTLHPKVLECIKLNADNMMLSVSATINTMLHSYLKQHDTEYAGYETVRPQEVTNSTVPFMDHTDQRPKLDEDNGGYPAFVDDPALTGEVPGYLKK